MIKLFQKLIQELNYLKNRGDALKKIEKTLNCFKKLCYLTVEKIEILFIKNYIDPQNFDKLAST